MSTIKSRIFIHVLFLLTLLTPSFSFAAGNMGFDGLNTLILGFANGVVRSTGYMMFTLAVVAFFFGIVQFIWSARQGSEGKGIQRGTQFMKWGLIAIFVMFSVWGIVKFAQGVFGIQGDNTIIVPSLNFIQSGGGGGVAGGGGGVGVGVGCTSTSQCAAGLSCVGSNASNKVCTAGAGGGVSCDPPNSIVNGICKTPSGTPVVPGGGSKKANGVGCVNSTECASDYCGPDNKCSVAAKGTKPFGYSCIDSTECKAGLYCGPDGSCTTATPGDKPFGYSCIDSTECKAGLYCGPDGSCTTATPGDKPFGYSCVNSTECKAGLYCGPDGSCTTATPGDKPFGYSCVNSTECKAGLYCGPDGSCTTATPGDKPFGYSCTGSEECASGLYCDSNNVCSRAAANEKANGYSCETSSECQSNFCDPADNTCSAVSDGGGGGGGGGSGTPAEGDVCSDDAGSVGTIVGGYCSVVY